MKKIFNKEDYNSNDGMLTSVWGPSMWHSLHTISFNYPVNPSKRDKLNYLNFFKSLQNILPCKYCRINYKKNIKKIPLNMNVMKNRYTFSKWLYDLHEEINKMLCKKSNLTFEQVQNRYENFRARCIDKKKKNKKKKKKTLKKPKKENGCIIPLYGKKSKCVINIVPKETKCKTFNIDRQCIIKAN
jgi:hypothetical protein